MRILRVFSFGLMLAGLGCVGAATLPGCDDQGSSGGQVVKVDPAESSKREQMIKDLYKTKGAAGQHPHSAKK